ncbi:biliverdin-producing heme oxygenase [Halomonas sp. MCCC 1A11062]|uniref:biliverdin-producing heme oxygenase n=1 Tax=Halomonas sp. MCCC 1A11062 TaxID=2733485 RepID=UPI001F169DC1|nr:biliverdin-producing heme oxygenase [Halomonas sp. MCCC 1A11062]MCE8037390.1 biliverdin-producing heme oxygenase [Halomonas sp. MCCC 1A11062]
METVTPPEQTTVQPLSKRLKYATREQHERVDHAIMTLRPFDDLEGYARFLRVQYGFQQRCLPVYRHPQLADWISDLTLRCRYAAVVRDCLDLNVDVDAERQAQAKPLAAPTSEAAPYLLGWLYVNEGSNLGAAFLFKRAAELGLSASYGARHLAPSDDGRGLHWRNFTQQLDAIPLPETGITQAIAGAKEAFACVEALARPLVR